MVCRILVADDSSTIQKVIKIGLAALQTEIRSAASHLEASKLVDQGSVDLIIADAGLPGVSTAADFVKLAERAGGVPIILLMGSYEAVKESDLRAVGITHIIKKPFPPGELPKLVQELTAGAATSAPSVSLPTAAPAANLPRAGVADIPAFLLADEAEAMAEAKASAPAPGKPPQSMASMPVFSISEETFPGAMPPAPEVEPSRKGRPAFDEKSAQETPLAKPFTAQSKPAAAAPTFANQGASSRESTGSHPVTHAGLSAAVESFVREELPTLVDRAVERYCVEHFKGVAREVLTAELRRLAEEKARYLVDQ
jgi:CheY-like chemotaxis protein